MARGSSATAGGCRGGRGGLMLDPGVCAGKQVSSRGLVPSPAALARDENARRTGTLPVQLCAIALTSHIVDRDLAIVYPLLIHPFSA